MRRFFAVCCALACSVAGAQSLLPIDSRPATAETPFLIAQALSSTARVVPRELLGTATRGADDGALLSWLEASEDGSLIVSLDALAYGGLVQSRKNPAGGATTREPLYELYLWQRRTKRPIYAFLTIPRHPDATPAVRARNAAAVRLMTFWAAEGVFQELHVAWDDALPGSPAPAEGAAARELARQITNNVLVYPGADEVLSMLVAKTLVPTPHRVRFVYADAQKASEIIRYEGIPLTESAHNHAVAAGFVEASPEERPDLIVYVHNGGDVAHSAARVAELMNEAPVALVDVAKVNMGTPEIWQGLKKAGKTGDLVALAAWGTPGNNLGAALAQGKMWLGGATGEAHEMLLARSYFNDMVFSPTLRAELRKQVPEAEMNTPKAAAALLKLAQPHELILNGNRYTVAEAWLPWGRSFEWNFRLAREK